MPTPALVYHPPDMWQPSGGINTGLLVVKPSPVEYSKLLAAMAELPPYLVGDGSDQAVWAYYL